MTAPAKELVRVGAIYGVSPVSRFSSDTPKYPHGFRDLYRVVDFDAATKRGNVVRVDHKTLEDSPEQDAVSHILRHNSATPVWIETTRTRPWRGSVLVSTDKLRADRWVPRWPFRLEGEPWTYDPRRPADLESALKEIRAWEERVTAYFQQVEQGHP